MMTEGFIPSIKDNGIYLGHNDYLVSGEAKLLYSLPKDNFTGAIGVYVGSIEGIDPRVVPWN
jgi:hypothetical protein